MKVHIDTRKGKEAFGEVVQKTMELGKKTTDVGLKAVESIQKGAQELADKSEVASFERRLKKYNPLFLDAYQSEEFILPKMIMLADDLERRTIDVCQGAIGWTGDDTGLEVLYLYDKDVEISGLQFIPNAKSGAIYYVDNFDPNRFVRVDCIFNKAHEERIAELQHIAHSLGAKKCSIELSESSVETQVEKKKFELKASLSKIKVGPSESSQKSLERKEASKRTGRVDVEFGGSSEITRPELKWFANDENIKQLIEMRCAGSNFIKKLLLELEGAASSTMSQETAYAIDNAITKIGVKGSMSMESQATKEIHSKFLLNIEFE